MVESFHGAEKNDSIYFKPKRHAWRKARQEKCRICIRLVDLHSLIQYEPAHFRSMSNVNLWNTLIHIIHHHPRFPMAVETWNQHDPTYTSRNHPSIQLKFEKSSILGWSKENQQENSLKLENFWISPCSSKSGNSIGISRVQQRVAKSRPPSATKM